MYADEQVILGREREVFPMPSSLATVIASIRPNQHVPNECVGRLRSELLSPKLVPKGAARWPHLGAVTKIGRAS